jgi:hypothetical protein
MPAVVAAYEAALNAAVAQTGLGLH